MEFMDPNLERLRGHAMLALNLHVTKHLISLGGMILKKSVERLFRFIEI
jgi:hypothetical protein